MPLPPRAFRACFHAGAYARMLGFVRVGSVVLCFYCCAALRALFFLSAKSARFRRPRAYARDVKYCQEGLPRLRVPPGQNSYLYLCLPLPAFLQNMAKSFASFRKTSQNPAHVTGKQSQKISETLKQTSIKQTSITSLDGVNSLNGTNRILAVILFYKGFSPAGVERVLSSPLNKERIRERDNQHRHERESGRFALGG